MHSPFEYPRRYSHILGLKILPFLKIVTPLSKVHGIAVILGGESWGMEAAKSPNHMAVNDRDMSLLGLQFSRRRDVHFLSTSVRSIPSPWARACNIMEGFHKRIMKFKASLKKI
jgi:hypothetical protein